MAGHGLPRSIPDVYERLEALEDGGGAGSEVAWEDITGVPATLTAAAAAGTPSIRAIGTTATTAAAGNHAHTGAQIALTGYTAGSAGNVAAADTVNAAIAKLEARIAALETP